MDFILNKRLSKSIEEYCNTNSLDINEYLNNLIEKAHFSFVYGEQPSIVKQPAPVPEPLIKTPVQIPEPPKQEPIDVPVIEQPIPIPQTPPMSIQNPPSKDTMVHTRGIQVVPISNKPKIRRLS